MYVVFSAGLNKVTTVQVFYCLFGLWPKAMRAFAITWHPSVVRHKLSHLNLLLWTKSDRDGPWVGPFQNCVGQTRPPFKMADFTKNKMSSKFSCSYMAMSSLTYKSGFLAHLAKGNVSFCHHLASVNFSHFNLLL